MLLYFVGEDLDLRLGREVLVKRDLFLLQTELFLQLGNHPVPVLLLTYGGQ